ncbi:MAG: patatin-like phospholipase family protein [Alphaproteobacteria bacterium]|nr:patatin-like phospholipase family protein [Alphaproteobacteria bacterium]
MKTIAILPFLSVLLLSGCATSQTSREASVFCEGEYLIALDDEMALSDMLTSPSSGRKSGKSRFHDHLYEMIDQKTISSRETRKQKYTVLVMSGGGQNGAFGAGVLNGWSARSDGVMRSDIDMITTISTGAMALTYALVGNYGLDDQRAASDEALRKIFTETSEDDLIEKKGLFSIISTNSLANTEGLGRMLDEAVKTFVPMVANWPEQGKWMGKSAFVGMVNMDDGRFYVVDLLHVARHTKIDPHAQDCYKEVILASSAEPVNFPPRFITTNPTVPDGGNMYVDGGLRFGLFWNENLKAIKDREMDIEVYVIVNGDLATNSFVCHDEGGCYTEKKTIKNKVLDIAKRSSTIVTDQLYIGSLNRIYWNLVKEFGVGNFVMNYTYIKPEYIEREYGRNKNCRKSTSLFDPVYMKCLYNIGVEVAETWDWQEFQP